MRNWMILLALTLTACTAAPTQAPADNAALAKLLAQIGDIDTGTYVVLDRNRNPTELFYRLSKSDGKWIMDGKEPGGEWKNVSCDRGCEYRPSSSDDVRSYFPADWLVRGDAACIQNMAQAFCRYTLKDDPKKGSYIVVALVTGQPIPLFLRRVPSS